MPPSPRPYRNSHATRHSDWDREEQAVAGMVDRALRDIALLVSTRGLCAHDAALLAHLPAGDVDLIAAACQCSACARRRMH